jgi:hypothetical protein
MAADTGCAAVNSLWCCGGKNSAIVLVSDQTKERAISLWKIASTAEKAGKPNQNQAQNNR